MENKTVKDLMVPLSEYATVTTGASLFEAVLALETAVKAFDPSRHRHRAILVLDGKGKMVGKISQMDILRALEPGYEQIAQSDSVGKILSPIYRKKLIEEYRLWNTPLYDLCRKASNLKVESFMQAPTEGEYVDQEASLDQAIHQLIMGRHQSLLVTDQGAIVGVLRLTDVFMEIDTLIKQCGI